MGTSGQIFHPAPPGYKDRRGWLIAFGIVEILIGCFFILMAAVMAFGISSMPHTSQQVPFALLYVVSLMYLGTAGLFVAIGIGSIRAKNWARITTLVVSWFWLVTGVFSVLMLALMLPIILHQQQTIMAQQPGSRPLPENFEHVIMVSMVALEAVTMVLVPLIFIVFYSSKNVKATCLAGSRFAYQGAGSVSIPAAQVPSALPVPPPGRSYPVPILILVIWFALGALSCAVTAIWIPVAAVMGHVVHGGYAHALLGAYALVSAYCAWGFFRRKIEAWWAAVAWYGFSSISAAISSFRVDPLAIQRQAGFMTPESERMFQALPHFFTVIQIASTVIAVGLWGFILMTRRYFEPNQSEQPSVSST